MTATRRTSHSMLVSEVLYRARTGKTSDPFVLTLMKQEFETNHYRLPQKDIDMLKQAYASEHDAQWLGNHVNEESSTG